MKKTLLLGTALIVGVAGFAQNADKKAINPKYLQKRSIYAMERSAAEPLPSNTPGIKIAKKGGNNSTNTTCNVGKIITTSYNCFGVGGGLTTSEQNCLSYNADLNTLIWTQRGSKKWAANVTSGYIQATLINPSTGVPFDSIIVFANSGNTHRGRFPGGTLLNATGNTNYHKAYAVGSGQATDGTNWIGAAYSAKPLWSTSAVGHTAPIDDSLYSAAATAASAFGNCASANFTGAPATDMQALSDGKTVVVIGEIRDPAFAATGTSPMAKGLFVKGVVNSSTKAVDWTVDSTSLVPNARVVALGHLLSPPRMAFGPDGMHGYAVFTGRLNQDFGNSCDSAMTPIIYKTTNGGTTWTQMLAGYDWVCKHPEILKNVGALTGKTHNFNFDNSTHGADVTVDANNVLHYVTIGVQPFHGTDIDSLSVYSYSYNYDYSKHHPIIWDFMTDGNTWKTLFVDSIITAPFASSTSTTDSTHAISPMGGTSGLAVTAHITVSRSTDGSKIFYGWADSDPNVVGPNATNGATYNSSPDLQVVAYDVNTNKISAKKTVTTTGNVFYPFLADQSYFDAGQSAWVVPAVYTAGDVPSQTTPNNIYDASAQADYYYTNCGTFTAADFNTTAYLFIAPTGTTCSTASLGIEKVNQFAASVSNYPNPFSNTTTIAVTLTESKSFSVTIYNAIGTLVYSKKVNGNVGENNVTFDGGTLSSGVYYYTVNAGNEQATKKMIIQK